MTLQDMLQPGYHVEKLKTYIRDNPKEVLPTSFWAEFSQRTIQELYGAPMMGDKQIVSINMPALRLLTFLECTNWDSEACMLVLDKNNKELVRSILDMNIGGLLLRKYAKDNI